LNCKNCTNGNSFFKSKNDALSATIKTSQFKKISSLIIGIQRVVCPSPQSNGATITRGLWCGLYKFSLFFKKFTIFIGENSLIWYYELTRIRLFYRISDFSVFINIRILNEKRNPNLGNIIGNPVCDCDELQRFPQKQMWMST
jgi:hypothetical protein